MDQLDPHSTYSYSHDQVLMTAFDYEIRNNLAVNPKYDNVKEVIEGYLKERVTEIRERWK